MNDELEDMEWINGYEALKRVNRDNAFTVPDNYFQEMEGQIMASIRLDQLKQTHTGDGFTVPENYFDELAQNIQSRIAIDDVLNTEQGFTVPENYFDELTQNIQSRIIIDEAVNAEEGFTIPENYFDGLTQNIQSRIAIDEALNTEQGFTVPENYFDELEQNIQSRIAIDEAIQQGFTVPENYFAALENKILQNTTNVPVKPIGQERGVIRKLWVSKAFKYASVACFALFVGGAVLVSEFNDTAIHNRSDLHKAFSKVSDKDIESYLQVNGDTPAIMENTDPNSLNSLLSSDSADQDTTN